MAPQDTRHDSQARISALVNQGLNRKQLAVLMVGLEQRVERGRLNELMGGIWKNCLQALLNAGPPLMPQKPQIQNGISGAKRAVVELLAEMMRRRSKTNMRYLPQIVESMFGCLMVRSELRMDGERGLELNVVK